MTICKCLIWILKKIPLALMFLAVKTELAAKLRVPFLVLPSCFAIGWLYYWFMKKSTCHQVKSIMACESSMGTINSLILLFPWLLLLILYIGLLPAMLFLNLDSGVVYSWWRCQVARSFWGCCLMGPRIVLDYLRLRIDCLWGVVW